MIELPSNTYIFRTRPDILSSESQFRDNLNISNANSVMFNVLVLKNSSILVEYDAVIWSKDKIWFIEYKDSKSANKRMSAKRVQQISDTSRNIARSFGFLKYNFTVVVKDIDEMRLKGTSCVIPLENLNDFEPEYSSSYEELEYLDKLIKKYENNDIKEISKDTVLSNLNTVRSILINKNKK